MNSSFIYDIPTRVYFGENQLSNLGKELKKYGNRVLLTYGGGSIKKTGLYDAVRKEIESAGMELYELSGIEPNPRLSSVNSGAKICREKNIDVLLAVGGGSVLDCTKFIGAARYYDGDAWDILLGKVDVRECLPIVTVLTLSATGSEMDAGGVITNPETQDKIGRIFPVMQPKVSFLDPRNTYTVSKYQTACGAADIISHILEVYFSRQDDLYMLDCVMEGLLKTVIKYTPAAIAKPDDYEARANLMWASSWAINGFIKGGKNTEWSCHPIEHELSAIYDITHGLGLAIVTPRWMRYCLDESTVERFRQFAVNVFDINKSIDAFEAAELGIKKIEEFFFNEIGLTDKLSKLGIGAENIPVMARKAVEIGNLKDAYKPLGPKDVEKILTNCL